MSGDGASAAQADFATIDRTLNLAICQAERAMLNEMRRKGEIDDRVFRNTAYEIDLAESLLKAKPARV